jgi:hypothetical protein
VLLRKDVSLLTMYGRLFLAHVDHPRKELVLFRFYRDAMMRQHTFPLYSKHLGLSVVDNAMLMHAMDSGVVMVFDILGGGGGGGERGKGGGGSVNGSGGGSGLWEDVQPVAAPLPLGVVRLPPPLARTAPAPSPALRATYGPGWRFAGPDAVIDPVKGRAWRLQLDLRALAQSSSDRPALVSFLQRRSQAPWAQPRIGSADGADSASPGLPVSFQPFSSLGSFSSPSATLTPAAPAPVSASEDSPQGLSVSLILTMLRERQPLVQVAPVFAVMCAAYADARFRAAAKRRTQAHNAARLAQANSSDGRAPHATATAAADAADADADASDSLPLLPGSPALCPSRMYTLVFSPLADDLRAGEMDMYRNTNGDGDGDGAWAWGADRRVELVYVRAAIVDHSGQRGGNSWHRSVGTACG